MKSNRISPKLTPLLLGPLLGLSAACASPAEPAPEPGPKTYLLDVTEQDWAEPRGIGVEIDAFVPNFLMRIDSESAITLATAKTDGTQDMCNVTRTVTTTKGDAGVTIGPTE